jgi:hypothetical protein
VQLYTKPARDDRHDSGHDRQQNNDGPGFQEHAAQGHPGSTGGRAER